MTIDYYYTVGSPPCAVVSLVMAELGIESNVKTHHLSLVDKEHLSEEYMKMNPQHTAPTIIDDGFALSESRSIAKYLVAKYGNNKYYPQDLKTRALIDQRLDFDIGTLYARLGDVYYAMVGGTSLSDDQLKRMDDAWSILNRILEDNEYVVGSEPTLADLSLAVTALMFEAAKVSLDKYTNIAKWLSLVRSTVPKFEEVVSVYVKDFARIFGGLSKLYK